MSREPRISPVVKKYIASESLKQINKPRNILAIELKSFIDNSGMGRSPAEETIIRLISQARAENSPLEKPWSLATLNEYPISPDGLPKVLYLKVLQDALEIDNPPDIQRPLTIRQAIWVDRLHYLFTDLSELFNYAFEYANLERNCESLKIPFDTSNVDSSVIYSLKGKISKALDLTYEEMGISTDWIIEHGDQDGNTSWISEKRKGERQ